MLIEGFFDASFGEHRLHVLDVRGSDGRDVLVQSPNRGNLHRLNDKGEALRDVSMDIIFTDDGTEADGDYLDRFTAFRKTCRAGEAKILVHPINGSYLARAGSFTYSYGSDEICIKCTVQFFEDREADVAATFVLATPSSASVDSVQAHALNVDAAAASLGVSVPEANDASTAVAAWSADTAADPNRVYVDVAVQLGRIDALIDQYEQATDFESWELFKSLLALRYEIVRAASAATKSVARLMEYTVAKDAPLRQICASIYGTAAAEDRASEIADINRIRAPGSVRAGTKLKIPSGGA